MFPAPAPPHLADFDPFPAPPRIVGKGGFPAPPRPVDFLPCLSPTRPVKKIASPSIPGANSVNSVQRYLDNDKGMYTIIPPPLMVFFFMVYMPLSLSRYLFDDIPVFIIINIRLQAQDYSPLFCQIKIWIAQFAAAVN